MLNGLRRRIAGAISPDKDLNKYAMAFLKMIGGQWTQYDTDQKTYIEKGILYNPDVYSIIKQQTDKAQSIPWKVMRDEDELDFPMERPNPMQTWAEVKALQKMFLRLTGNVYLYVPKPLNGINSGVPQAVYVLPSHLMKIELKPDIDLSNFTESPVKCYTLIENQVYTEFEAENVIHIKYPNPDFDFNGSHLYGLSPLRPLLRNIQSSNEAIDNNNRTLLNGGVYGFITGKNMPLNQEQAKEVKERLIEMRSSETALGQVRGASAQLEFTKMSLNTDELKPFEFLKFDQKQLCNALNWSDKLLNNDEGGKYDNIKQFRKQVITDNMMPDNMLIDEAYTDGFLKMFKGYEDATLLSSYDELPEMQEDMTELSKWLSEMKDRGVMNAEEVREKLGLEKTNLPEMQVFAVKDDIIPLQEALALDIGLDEQEGVQA